MTTEHDDVFVAYVLTVGGLCLRMHERLQILSPIEERQGHYSAAIDAAVAAKDWSRAAVGCLRFVEGLRTVSPAERRRLVQKFAAAVGETLAATSRSTQLVKGENT
jgi:hypothetical protein